MNISILKNTDDLIINLNLQFEINILDLLGMYLYRIYSDLYHNYVFDLHQYMFQCYIVTRPKPIAS